jgi:DNA polymerase III epsilon subunit-like protein
MSNKPKGCITRFLVVDTETSGLIYNSDDPSGDDTTGQYFQAVSMGLIVVDAEKLEPIEELYLEIEWDGISTWSPQAEAVHGLSKSYLADNGISTQEAVTEIAGLILEHWGPKHPVCIAGHNPSFDLAFLKRLLRSEGMEVRFGSKVIDTNSIGFAVYGTHNSDDLFEAVGFPTRDNHNSLDDARAALQVIKVTRMVSDECFGG